ncbi:hypothetical protein PGT21_012884 [Puccinia graminis f. sp. tritici]|uniref:Uncharacterized protein n=1 Tax=Puccinia graminis f. sp. tritici TaxID=56615 RepID=A0A5B0M6E6_PUCGR|nr:hypothetical protein PGTUg99_022847 [Puccinia graminis f. sp. tritici]KAA1071608.1 hypothetical protein PGT21_012884 [Puccinia graminis f. sp. tritici]
MSPLSVLPNRRLLWSIFCCFTIAAIALAMDPSEMREFSQESAWSSSSLREADDNPIPDLNRDALGQLPVPQSHQQDPLLSRSSLSRPRRQPPFAASLERIYEQDLVERRKRREEFFSRSGISYRNSRQERRARLLQRKKEFMERGMRRKGFFSSSIPSSSHVDRDPATSTNPEMREFSPADENIFLKDATQDYIRRYVVAKANRKFARVFDMKEPLIIDREQKISHKTLPFALATYADGKEGRPSRVLRADTNSKLNKEEWKFLYSPLTTSLSSKHHEDLKSLSTTDYKVEQTKLINWLDKEIFAPDNGLPVTGLSRNSFGTESIDEVVLGANQLRLIEYFAWGMRNRNNPEHTESAATELLESYKDDVKKAAEETKHASSAEHSEATKSHRDPDAERYGFYHPWGNLFVEKKFKLSDEEREDSKME